MPTDFRVRTVRIKRLADDSEQDMPLKSWNYIKDDIDDVTRQKKFDLVGYYDQKDKLVHGDPNRPAPVQVQEPKQNAVPVVEGPSSEEAPVTPVTKKRGRPANVVLQETQA